MKTKLQKLRHTSLDELRVRGLQAFSAFAERKGLSRRARLMSDAELLDLLVAHNRKVRSASELRDYLRSRAIPHFFLAFANKEATVSEFQRRWPESVQEIVERADRIVAGSFDLLGFRQLNFGSPIDWHLEPVLGRRASLVHWSRLNYLDAERFGDKKIVWELNRQQYFATLGQAYWLTGDERYAQTFVAHIESWMRQNPPKLGINWASNLEVAFRSISWIWALHFFIQSDAPSAECLLSIIKFLYLNALHLETYLSTYFSPNTHLTGEALGLFYLGTMLPEFEESDRWRKKGLRILLERLAQHVQSDGVYFEQSSYYHRYTTDFYLHLRILLSINEEPIPQEIDEKLKLLLDHLMFITRPDGTSPMFGDDDGGRLVKLDNRASNDFRSTLSTGAAIFNRGDYKFVSGGISEETLWLLGADGLRKLDGLNASEPTVQSVGFEKSGYYVMRDGWTPLSNYLFFDCGHHGTDNCGHAHADALSIELAVNGRTLLVDPGTYTYTASKDLRDSFRASTAHNTLTVDDNSWSVPAGPFSWKSIASNRCSRWLSKERFDYILASQESEEIQSKHYREIVFLKKNYWILRDRLDSFGTHQLRTWLHFDSNVEPLREKEHAIRVIGENGHRVVLQISTFAERGAWVRESGWVSHCYGSKEVAPVFAFAVDTNGPEELVTFLIPETATSNPIVREIEALHGRAFEINFGGKHDVLLLNNEPGNLIETARFISDFAVAWFRFPNEEVRSPEELVLIGGQTVELDGRVLLKSSRTIDFLTGSTAGDRFKVETNEGMLEIPLPISDLESLFADLKFGSTT